MVNAAPLRGRGSLEAEGLGTLWLVWSDEGLVRLDFVPPELDDEPPVRNVPKRYAETLRRYFAGEDVDPASVAVDLRGTPFQRAVWTALREIPRGTVRTYGSIAADVGAPRGMRAVGAANSVNPVAIVVPCHRVVEVGHRLGGYSGGLERKKRLLELEGVRVVGNRVLPGQMDLF